jgi:uncharacterized repeat protein (TIGR03803 family)
MCATAAIGLPAQTFTTLHNFGGTGGNSPFSALVQTTNGSLYGTTCDAQCGVGSGNGTLFKITPGGMLTTLYNFCSQSGCTDGVGLVPALLQAHDGNLYGATAGGGANGPYGTLFKITQGGILTVLHSFDGKDGQQPYGALVQATDGNLYGTTGYGGANGSIGGTVFKITPSGVLTTLYSFCSQSGCIDGELPFAGLVQGADGNLYGTTAYGGSYNGGTIFKITPHGVMTTLHSFCSQSGCTDGAQPAAALIQATDGNFYGTTEAGGAAGMGTVFRITSSGMLTCLYSFCSKPNCTDGEEPYAGLVQATDGNLYGTTTGGGVSNGGAIFKVTLAGALTTLHSFCSQRGCTDGAVPFAGLVQDTNGKFYGTTFYGGADSSCTGGCGTVFGLSVGLGPFVETEPIGGKVAANVKVLGTNLTGATSVTFNGTPATFTVEEPSVIKATVPAGAATGTVQVVTPTGTLSSNVPFRVAP